MEKGEGVGGRGRGRGWEGRRDGVKKGAPTFCFSLRTAFFLNLIHQLLEAFDVCLHSLLLRADAGKIMRESNGRVEGENVFPGNDATLFGLLRDGVEKSSSLTQSFREQFLLILSNTLI